MGWRKKIPSSYCSHEATELDEKLQIFFVQVRKKNGSDYETNSLWVTIASLDHHLKEGGNSISIAEDREFVNIRKILEGKAHFPVNRATTNTLVVTTKMKKCYGPKGS